MIKAVVFDMDGLMFDTERMWVEEGFCLAKRLGYDIPKDIFVKTIGLKDNIAGMFFKAYLKNLPFTVFRDIYHKCIDDKIEKEGLLAKKGLKELLIYLQENNYKIAVASSNQKDRIYFYLKKVGIDYNIFDEIISGDDVKYSKPNPDIFIKVANKLKESPKNILVLEDSVFGAVAAKNINCNLIIVPDIMEVPKELDKYKVNSLLDVIVYLSKQ